jgi:tRNA threonylcarbamoyl adenosine modification protein (Sua5/YciO/YrdC/YwlC family)
MDFLESIATRTSSGATSALWDSGLAAVQLKDAIDRAEAEVKTEYASIKPKRDEPKPTGIDPEQARKMEERLLQKHAEASSELRAEGPSDVPAPGQGFSPEPKPKPEILVCDPNNPDIDSVERAADALLEGRLVAFPIDTMYALAADATNPAAVERIRTALQRDHSQHFGALIHSTTQLKHLVKPVPAGVLDMLDELWPGPLTVVFERHPNRFAHLSNEPTLGLRIPSDYLSLAILSTVGRPLAATSIKLKDGEGARQVAEQLAGVVDVVIDTKQASAEVITTVLSVGEGGPKILRAGATNAQVIDAHVRKLQDG